MKSLAFKVIATVMFLACTASAQEKGLVFAHRGGAHEFEENTLAAFKESYARGLRGFETDVRMTQDGMLVIPWPSIPGRPKTSKPIRSTGRE